MFLRSWFYWCLFCTLCPSPPKKKPGTHIMANNFRKHRNQILQYQSTEGKSTKEKSNNVNNKIHIICVFCCLKRLFFYFWNKCNPSRMTWRLFTLGARTGIGNWESRRILPNQVWPLHYLMAMASGWGNSNLLRYPRWSGHHPVDEACYRKKASASMHSRPLCSTCSQNFTKPHDWTWCGTATLRTPYRVEQEW